MTGVCMTPPCSPGHCSDFYGFTDDEDDNDDNISCSDFCGFTEEEQVLLVTKNSNRLSRDSGVGVDVNNLTPDKEPLEIIFERNETTEADIENCKQNINFDQKPKETTESLLKELSDEIRDALALELRNTEEENVTQVVEDNAIDKSFVSQGQTLQATAVNGDSLCTENACEKNSEQNMSIENTENASSKITQQKENISTEGTDLRCLKSSTANTESQSLENANNSQAMQSLEENTVMENTENLTETEDSNHLGDCVRCDTEDDIMLDWNTQGIKTKVSINVILFKTWS